MGGIYSKEDTSFLIMCSSFLFPINIWNIFIGSQFSSAISHMVPQHRLFQALKEHRETLLLESSENSSPALSEAGQGVTNTRRNSRKKRNITTNKVVQQLWKKKQAKVIQFV